MRLLPALLVSLALGCDSTHGDGNASVDLGGSPGVDAATAPPDVAGGTSLSGALSGARDVSGEVLVTDDLIINAGASLTLAAGTTVRVATGKRITVRGTLTANGTAASPVSIIAYVPTGGSDWEGLGVAGGGSLVLRGTTLRNATVAVQAAAGSSFDIDGALIEQSAAAAYLSSSGTIKYSVIHAQGAKQSGEPVVISDASPRISDTLIDNANGGTDMVAVNGVTSGPVFDHVAVQGSHCAFHLNGGIQVTVTGSLVKDNVYGMMVVGSKNTVVSGNNFTQNNINIGSCTTGSVTATGNFFVGEIFDASCANQTVTGAQNSPLPAVGPRPRP